MYTFYCTNMKMASDVLREMNDRPDVREFIEVIIIKKLEPKKFMSFLPTHGTRDFTFRNLMMSSESTPCPGPPESVGRFDVFVEALSTYYQIS